MKIDPLMKIDPNTPIVPGEHVIAGHGQDYATDRVAGTRDYQLLLTSAGRGRFSHRTGMFEVVPGDLVLILPKTAQTYGPMQRSWHWRWVHFHPPECWLDLLHWPEAGPGLLKLHVDDPRLCKRMAQRMLDIEMVCHQHGDNNTTHNNNDTISSGIKRDRLAMNAVEEILLWCDSLCPRHSNDMDPRIRIAMDRLGSNLTASISRSGLARACGLSQSHFSALFQQEIGVGVVQYRDQLRMQHACALLKATDQPIQDIAATLGYDNPFYFTTRFTRFTGLSPRAYRRSQRAESCGPD